MNEIKGDFNDVLIVTELRGGFPNVAIASDVDYSALIAGDENPVFLTLPIGKANVTSGNKRFYDETWLQELDKQTMANRPIGLMGHLSTADRAHAFPTEAIHWVGTLREGDLLWGKGYVPPGEARQRIQRYKAQGKKIATSIDAYGEGVWDNTLGAYRMNAGTMRLNQIDIAPADRAGVPSLAAVPMLSSEMASPTVDQQQKDKPEERTTMDKLQVITELTADDARLLPDAVRAAIVAAVPTPAEVGIVTELRTALGATTGADLIALITGLKKSVEDNTKLAVNARIRELVEDKDKGVKVVSMRGVITELINAQKPTSIAEAEAAYAAVVARDTVKGLLVETVQAVMGPAQTTPLGADGKPKAPTYFTIPTEAAA